MMDYLLFFLIGTIISTIQLKGYYTYKFLVIENLGTLKEGFWKFSLNAEHYGYKLASFYPFAIISRASTEDSKRAKKFANVYLTGFYVSGIVLIVLLIGLRSPSTDILSS